MDGSKYMIKILLYTFMRYIKLFEDFDWSDKDFDYEDEYPVEIIGNQYFTDFLVERDLYDKFVKSAIKCHHNSIHISSIKDINDKIKKRSVRNVIFYIIHWACSEKLHEVNWQLINNEWNKLCDQNPSYKNIEL